MPGQCTNGTYKAKNRLGEDTVTHKMWVLRASPPQDKQNPGRMGAWPLPSLRDLVPQPEPLEVDVEELVVWPQRGVGGQAQAWRPPQHVAVRLDLRGVRENDLVALGLDSQEIGIIEQVQVRTQEDAVLDDLGLPAAIGVDVRRLQRAWNADGTDGAPPAICLIDSLAELQLALAPDLSTDCSS